MEKQHTVSDVVDQALIQLHPDLAVAKPQRKDLWDMPALFLAALGLAFTEWGYRKWRGLT